MQVRRSLAVGIEQAVIDAINARRNPSLADAREHTCLVVPRELLASKGLSDEPLPLQKRRWDWKVWWR